MLLWQLIKKFKPTCLMNALTVNPTCLIQVVFWNRIVYTCIHTMLLFTHCRIQILNSIHFLFGKLFSMALYWALLFEKTPFGYLRCGRWTINFFTRGVNLKTMFSNHFSKAIRSTRYRKHRLVTYRMHRNVKKVYYKKKLISLNSHHHLY